MKTLKDLFESHLQDLYNTEEQILNIFPRMLEVASDVMLKTALNDHIEETRIHKIRIRQICNELETNFEGKICLGITGLINAAENFIEENTSSQVLNAGLLAHVRYIEHYEIAAYDTAIHYALELGYTKIVEKLRKTLNEEYNADDKLADIAGERLTLFTDSSKK